VVKAPELIHAVRHALAQTGEGSSDYDLHPDIKLPKTRKLRPAAVLMPFIVQKDELELILTKRSSALKHHPGQIAFPGGKIDPDDDGPIDAALREAREEIGLPEGITEVLGTLPAHETVTGFTVTPVLGLIQSEFSFVAEEGEVEEVFTVPARHVTSLAQYRQQGRIWQGQMRMYETVPFGPYYVWGATARMLRALAERMPQ